MNTKQSGFIQRSLNLWDTLTGALDALQPLAAFLARLYLAQVFFLSGLTKLRDWETTVALFTDEYHVPLLSPPVAAALGTAGELALPVLLVLGLGGRLSALGLFVVNFVAVISLSEIARRPFSSTCSGVRCWPRWPFSVWGRGHLTAGWHPGGTLITSKTA